MCGGVPCVGGEEGVGGNIHIPINPYKHTHPHTSYTHGNSHVATHRHAGRRRVGAGHTGCIRAGNRARDSGARACKANDVVWQRPEAGAITSTVASSRSTGRIVTSTVASGTSTSIPTKLTTWVIIVAITRGIGTRRGLYIVRRNVALESGMVRVAHIMHR